MDKIKYKVMSSLLPKVDELAKDLSNSMNEFIGGDHKIKLGFQIATITVTAPFEKRYEIKEKLEPIIIEKLKDVNKGTMWLEIDNSKEQDNGI